MLPQLLQKIGLTDKDAEVYLACLELGTQPASVIAKKASLKRPTTYLILEGLLKRGLVSEYNGANVKYFTAVSPDYLVNYVEKQKRELSQHQHELEQYLPQLHSLANPYTISPKVRFYEGVEGIERVMDDTLKSSTKIMCYSSTDSWFSRQDTRDYITQYGRKRVHQYKIPMRAMYLDTELSRKYHEMDYPRGADGTTLSEWRWFDKSVTELNNEINIYDNKVAIVTISRTELIGIIIESKEIANTHRAIFEEAWRNAKIA
ncbi:hypothetical protein KBD59_03385 [Candidatus Gracilibacteria bacterium]|nr:hypothetical protein [Candidatus Gracilibacteria bacterium]